MAAGVAIPGRQVSQDDPTQLAKGSLPRADADVTLARIQGILPMPEAGSLSNHFLNGHYFVQHQADKVQQFFNAVAQEIEAHVNFSPPYSQRALTDFLANPRIGDRYPGTLPEHVDSLMYRAACIDTDCREWGQAPYARRDTSELLERANSAIDLKAALSAR